MQVNHREVWIDVCQSPSHHRVEILRWSLKVQRHGVDVERSTLRHYEIRLRQPRNLLRQRAEVHRPHLVARVGVFGVCHDTDDLERRGKLLIENTEASSDGVFLGKELLHKRLIDHRDFL
jgi:hypothetical protein